MKLKQTHVANRGVRYLLPSSILPIISVMGFLVCAQMQRAVAQPPSLTRAQLLAEVEKRAFQFFWVNADPKTGLISDRAVNHGNETRHVSSIASTGYGLASLAIGARHGWVTRQKAIDRAALTLDLVLNKLHKQHTLFYHFVVP